MSGARSGALGRDLEAIFQGGSTSALGDGALLDRFSAGGGLERERAFEALMGRHGPMVYQVCRRRLGDRHEAEDACQAVFLVLARCAGSVRNRESVAGWLHGVAVRVAARARKDARKRLLREQRAAEVAAAAGVDPTRDLDGPSEAVHEELARLPEKYRSPIVLCYLEGLTHEQAAARLGSPVGTVRSRLSRGRDQLRRRLTRRGVTAPSVVVPWVGPPATDAPAVGSAPPELPLGLSAGIVRAACSLSGPQILTSSLSPASLALMKGVIAAMRLEQLALFAALSVPAGAFVLAAGFVIAQEPTPAPGPAAGAAAVEPSRSAQSDQPGPEGSPPAVDDLVTRSKELAESLKGDRSDLVKLARERFEIQKLYFQEGRITVDRMIDASAMLMEAERLAARDDAKKAVDAIKRHVDFMRELESAWRKMVETGMGTMADLSELSVTRRRGELMLSEAVKAGPDDRVTRLERRIQALESRLDAVLKRLDAPPR
jgi:RNA polymerase sigma factor (sigma-70 family)